MRITTNKFRAGSTRLARSMADLVSKNGRFWAVFMTIVLKVEDDRQCVKWAFAMRAIVLPWVLNKACTLPWCYTVVHFEVKMRRF